MQSRTNRALAALASGPMDMAKLANIVGISSHDLVDVLRPLRKDGLVSVTYRFDKVGRHAIVSLVRNAKQPALPKQGIYYAGKLAS